MSSNGSGIAAPPTTFPHAPWCDQDRHDDGTTHPIPDANWQICFGPLFELDFGDRGNSATLDLIRGDLSFEHTDVWGETADPFVYVSFDGADGIKVTPDQLLPVANLLRAVDALYKGNAALADTIMLEARAGVVEFDLDDEREQRREAARRAWQEKAAAEEAARRAVSARQQEEIAQARSAVREQAPRVAAAREVTYYEQRLAEARAALATALQAEAVGGAA